MLVTTPEVDVVEGLNLSVTFVSRYDATESRAQAHFERGVRTALITEGVSSYSLTTSIEDWSTSDATAPQPPLNPPLNPLSWQPPTSPLTSSPPSASPSPDSPAAPPQSPLPPRLPPLAPPPCAPLRTPPLLPHVPHTSGHLYTYRVTVSLTRVRSAFAMNLSESSTGLLQRAVSVTPLALTGSLYDQASITTEVRALPSAR